MDRQTWLKNLKSDPGTQAYYEENKDHLDFAEKEKARFLNDWASGKKPPLAVAVFGPEEDGYANGYIEDITTPETGGTFCKYYGCPFLAKGMHPKNVVFGMQLSKHLFSQFPRSIFKHSKLLSVSLVLAWLFNRKGFLNILCDLTHAIDHKVVQHLTYSQKMDAQWPQKWYNEVEKEIERCLLLASKGEGLWEKFFKLFTPWLKLFLYIDNTYKSRIQDSLYEAKDLLDCLRILYSREVKTQGSTGTTWWLYKQGFRVMLLTSPALRRIEKRFFKNVDKEKIKMDADDWYFALTYKSYNFRGLDYEVRKAERKRLNELNKIVFL